MFNKLLIKIIKKFAYVKNLEINVEQLKAVETRLREEKGDAVREKNRLALKVKYMESVVIDLIENPHMIFTDEQGKFISIDEAALRENENKHVIVDDITSEDIRLYMAKRLYQDKVTKTSVGNEIRAMSSFFSYIFNEELIDKNPMQRIEKIKKEKTKKEAFTELELEKMRAELKTNREKAIFEVLLSTGCRVAELVNIKTAEINGEEILVHGKGEKDRTVYLNAKAQWALNEYLSERSDSSPYLFPGGYYEKQFLRQKSGNKRIKLKEWYKNPNLIDESKHIDPGTIESTIRNIGKKAGVQAHPHKFRRTCATFALRRGMPIEYVSKMLGHEAISTTQIYLDLSEQDLKTAHRKYVI